MLLAFVPMLFIAAAYYYLNRADPDCGTTFTWVTRAIGPKTGWLAGWGILVTDLVVMPNLASVAGVYTFNLFGAHGIAANSSGFWVTFVGVVWIIVMTAICYIGIELSARHPGGAARGRDPHPGGLLRRGAGQGVRRPHRPQRPPFASSGSTRSGSRPIGALSAGMLLAVFIYWGWDTAVTVNEEAKDARRTPGVAALLSTVVLVLIYVVVSDRGPGVPRPRFPHQPTSDDVLGALGNGVLGSPWDKLLIICVLTSASSSTQTTILPAARSSLSMAVHKAFPKRFADIHPKYLSPGFSTLLFGAVAIVWYVALTIISPGDVLANSIEALGFGIAFYYGLTGFACVIYYRRHIFTSFKNFIFIGLAPFLGAVILTVLFVVAIFYYSDPANSSSGTRRGSRSSISTSRSSTNTST